MSPLYQHSCQRRQCRQSTARSDYCSNSTPYTLLPPLYHPCTTLVPTLHHPCITLVPLYYTCTPSSLSSSLVEEETYGQDYDYDDDYDDDGGGGGGGGGGGDSATQLEMLSERSGVTTLASTFNVMGTGRGGDRGDTHRDTHRDTKQCPFHLWRSDGSLDEELLKHMR